VPSLVVAEKETAGKSRASAPPSPTMPDVIGGRLDEVERELRTHRIVYSTDAPEIAEALVPGLLEVCNSEPPSGRTVRSGARLHVALAGTCHI
jgi:hypothetical protein